MTPAGLRERLAQRILVLDGGLATELEAKGAQTSGPLWSARVLRDEPAAVVDAHRAFVQAGAEVLISSSYQVSRRGLIASGGSAQEADVLLGLSVRLAREAAGDSGALVAASIGPYGATNHDGSEYRGRYGLTVADLVAFHSERLEPLLEAGPDLLAVETIPDLAEVEAIARVAAGIPDVPLWVSVTTLDGRTVCAGERLEEVAGVLRGCANVVAIGVNCSAPRLVAPALAALGSVPGPALLAYPNAGQAWNAAAESWSGEASPVLPTADVVEWIGVGARAIGGCCGIGPEGIEALALTLTEC